MPEEPPPSSVTFPPPSEADENGLVMVGGDLEPGTVLAAYRAGLFPMRVRSGELGWWSPDPRGVLDPGALRVSRSLRRSCRRFDVTVDTAFDDVIRACASGRPVWITEEVQSAYSELHRLGWAHSIEVWSSEHGGEAELVGGLYGLAVGGLFSGESMFSRGRDGSKVALVALDDILVEAGDVEGRLIDLQWLTPHFETLGARAIPRSTYLDRLATALALAPPPFG